MRLYLLIILILCWCQLCYSQEEEFPNPTINIRSSVLIFPARFLLTFEVRTFGNLTLQFESNFVNTHGVNLKYFLNQRMSESYLFSGIAFVEDEFLREDSKVTFLPYLGYGYAHRFGERKLWTFDSRIGLGITTNTDSDGIYPVIKTGIGRIF